jgi:hypothetical protein
VQHRVVELLAEVGIGLDVQPYAHGQAGVVEGAQPGLGGLRIEAYLTSAAVRQRGQDRSRLVDLGGLQVALGVLPELC